MYTIVFKISLSRLGDGPVRFRGRSDEGQVKVKFQVSILSLKLVKVKLILLKKAYERNL